MESQRRVFVVGDDASALGALEGLLRSNGFDVETFGSAAAFLERPKYHGIACLLVDQRTTGPTGAGIQEVIRRTGISMPIIFLSGRDSFPRPRRSSEGAVECLAAPVNESMLVDAVMRASARAFALESRRRVIHDTEVRLARLTGREREVCDLLTRRLVNRQIAYELGTTERTVMAHRGRIMHKLEVDSVDALIELVGLQPEEPQFH
jgi:FixJ family two-component response regulator